MADPYLHAHVWYVQKMRDLVLYFHSDGTVLKNGRLQGWVLDRYLDHPRRRPRIKRLSLDARRDAGLWHPIPVEDLPPIVREVAAPHIAVSRLGNRRRRARHGSMQATHYAVSTSAAQQKALVEIRQAEKYMGSTPGTRRARKLFDDGDFTGAAHVAHQAFLADRRKRGSRGDMRFGAGHPLPVGATFNVTVATLRNAPGIWYVSGPRVLRGGRVDYTTNAYYGTINKKTGELHVWGGKGAAGTHYRTYLEVVRDRIKRRFKIASSRTGELLVRVARDARRR